MPASGFRAALQRYAQIRAVVFDVAWENASRRLHVDAPFRFAPIDLATLDVWRATWTKPHPFRYGGWDWNAIVQPIWRRPAGLSLAVWSADRLCGLLAGRPSRRGSDGHRHTLSLHYLEGNADRNHPLRGHVADLALGAAELYARALGASRVRLVEPLPGVHRIYKRLGYGIVQNRGSRIYFEKRIDGHAQART